MYICISSLYDFSLFQICIDAIAGSYWSEWSGWSECSRECDGGARFKTRQCLQKRRHWHTCPGEHIGYATCNNEVGKAFGLNKGKRVAEHLGIR